jgi:hypothetical protein
LFTKSKTLTTSASGADFNLSKEDFDMLYATMFIEKRLDTKQLQEVRGIPGLYKLDFSAYDTKYENTTGSAVFFYNAKGVVGFGDKWNFESQQAGNRPGWGEVKTYIGAAIPGGVPFYVLYGVHPPRPMIGN